jgi:superfamily II DNA or RNA helicase
MLSIRPYQQTAINNILADWRDGFRRLLLMAATGTGKTVMFLAVASEILHQDPKARILIIAHRRELIYQPLERAGEYFPGLAFRMGVVMADRDDVASQVIVATVQSLAVGSRLERILQHGAIEYVIVDEAHHSTAGSYQGVIKALGEPKVLGCTATPKRSDNQALGDIFQKVSYRISIQDAIKQGALVPFTPLGFVLPANASNLKETADGWEDEPMGELLSTENILEIVYTKFKEFAGNRQTIGFTASVAQAHATAGFFNDAGVTAAAVDGTTPKQERDRILRSYQAGEIQIVFNCMVLTEGFDAPETGCVMMIAPTRSDLVYVQRLGRGLRTARGKSDCLVLDFAPRGLRDVVMAGDVLDGVPKQVKKSVQEAEESGVELFGFQVTGDTIQAIDPHEIQAIVLDYLKHHRLAWSFDGSLATAALSESVIVAILPPERERLDRADNLRRSGRWNDGMARVADWIGKYRLYRVDKKQIRGERYAWIAQNVGAWDSMTAAKAAAEELSKEYAGVDQLAGKRKPWRDKPMSEAQANYLRKLGAFKAGLTSGQAAQRITHTLAKQAVSRMESIKQKRLVQPAVYA